MSNCCDLNKLNGFTREEVENLTIQGELIINSVADDNKWIIKEDKITGSLLFNRNNDTLLELEDDGTLVGTGLSADSIKDTDNTTSITTEDTPETIIFTTNSTERARIDSGGNATFNNNVLVGSDLILTNALTTINNTCSFC